MDFDNLSSDAVLQKFRRLPRKFITYLSVNMCHSSLASSLFIMSKRVYCATRSESFIAKEYYHYLTSSSKSTFLVRFQPKKIPKTKNQSKFEWAYRNVELGSLLPS